ncbi:VanW family protein [Acetivibrio straminisolvens]|nr:VanW family protein [Acetivibrio straminisolvens]
MNQIKGKSAAVKCLDGIIINPGETFSYWRFIGKPTAQKGKES